MTAGLAKAKIDRLRKRAVPIASGPEALDGPLDRRVAVESKRQQHHLFIRIDETIVSELYVVEFEQQIGSQVIRVGGIADVRTHDDHRFKGYMRRVLTTALRWMRREGFDVSMLYGITSFYPKFGYAPAFPQTRFSIAVRDAEAVEPAGYRFVSYDRRYLRAVLRMYRASNAGLTGPRRRDARSWEPWRLGASWGSKALAKVALDRRGRPAGYYAYDDRHLHAIVIEVGFATPAVLPDVLRAAARHALSQRLERVDLCLPEDHLFVEYCKPLGLRKDVTYNRDGDAQVRMINIPTTLSKVADDIGSRMRGSGRLNVRTNLDDVGLAWSAGRLRVAGPHPRAAAARMPQWALAQLLYGYRSASGLAACGTLTGSTAVVDTLEQMLPVRPHYNYNVDYF